MPGNDAANSWLAQAWNQVQNLDGFIRLHQLFFTALWLLLGAASIGRVLAPSELARLLAVVLCFHVFTYVLNDVIDLPIDRTQPQRQNDPLVRGTIRPWQALIVAAIQPLLIGWMTVSGGGGAPALAVVGGGLGSMAAYNLWGKRCAFPPLTDAIQGGAWASLALYAPLAVGEPINLLAGAVAAYVAVFTLLFNGIHGSLRDLANDLRTGARTTAIFLGARPSADDGIADVPTSMGVYASAILIALLAIATTLLIRNDFGYTPVAWAATVAVAGAELLVAVILHPLVVRPRAVAWDRAWRLQLYLLMMVPATVFALHLDRATVLTLLVLNLMALLLFGCTARVAGWAWSAIQTVFLQRTSGRLVQRSRN